MASVVCPDFASMEISIVRGISASSVPGTWQYFKENDGNEIGENPSVDGHPRFCNVSTFFDPCKC